MDGARRQSNDRPQSPAVTVIIPAYNSAATLPRAIRSVMAQTARDWELIVVDDGSTDETPKVLARFRNSLGQRLRTFRTENRGPGAARNLGIEEAKGTYIAFLDADDTFLPDKLMRQLALFEVDPVLGLVFSDYAYIDVGGQYHLSVFDNFVRFIWDIPYANVGPGMRICGPELLDCMSGRYIVSTITGMVRRDVLGDDIRFDPNLRYCEEWLFFLSVCRRARAGYVAESLSLHYHTPGSVSRSNVRRNLQHRIRALRIVRDSHGPLSSWALRELGDQISASHRQLAYDHYKDGAFGLACKHFVGALRHQPDLRTTVHLGQALWRRLLGAAPEATHAPVER